MRINQLFLFSVSLISLLLVSCTGSPFPLANPTTENPILQPDYQIDVETVIASGFDRPLAITHAGDGSGRLFIVEKSGRIKIVQDGAVLPTPFLDIHNMISTGSEQGLLGLAFHPEYDENGYFFINYTDLAGNTQVVRYRISEDDNIADPASALILFSVQQPYANHNGGQITFGPDGYLYIALGDGGSANDPQNNAQNLNNPLGKILRITVNEDGTTSIPADNPFIETPGADARIWAWGLRNPWRFSFDRLNGDLYIADVGQNKWEEISYARSSTPGGQNFGWRCFEGSNEFDRQSACKEAAAANSLVMPVAEYNHSEGQSVTGGYVYRGQEQNLIAGVYFFADFISGKIWSIRLVDHQSETWSDRRLELESDLTISSFGEDESGELYIADYFGGTIRKLIAKPK